MKTFLALLVVFLFWQLNPILAAPSGSSASKADPAADQSTAELSDADLSPSLKAKYASAYPYIVLHLTNALTSDELASDITVTSQTNHKAITWKSEHSEIEDSPGKYKDFLLFSADMLFTNSYNVHVKYPSGKEEDLISTDTTAFAVNQNKLFGIFATSTNEQGNSFIQASPLAGSGNATGFQYSMAFATPSPDWWDGTVGLSLTSAGEISSESGTNKLLQALDIGVKTFFQKNVPTPFAGDSVFPAGLILKPIDVESTQDFKTVDHTTKLEGYMGVPYLECIQDFWYKMRFGDKRPKGLPMDTVALTTGYTFAYDIAKTTNAATPKGPINHRWDSEVKYKFYAFKDLEIDFSYNSYLGVGHSFYRQTLDIKPILYLLNGNTNRAGFFLEYTRGEMPPAFIPAKSNFRFGVTGKL